MSLLPQRASSTASLFRAGVPVRLAAAIAVSLLLWMAILWATT